MAFDRSAQDPYQLSAPRFHGGLEIINMHVNRLFAVRIPGLYCLAVCLFLVGCADTRVRPTFTGFSPENLTEKLDNGTYSKKINNFLVILDTSSTMTRPYLYEAYESNTTPTLFEVEKEIAHRLNLTIPEMDLNAGIRTYGFGPCQSWRFSLERLKLGPYDKTSFSDALATIECASGGSPMDYAIDLVAEDIETFSGKTGIIVISDGSMDQDPIVAVMELKKKYGSRICVHTISLAKNPGQRVAMRRLSAVSRCGYTTTAEEVATTEGMAEFVEKVFLQKDRARNR